MKLRDNLNDLKQLISSRDKFVKFTSVEGEFIVANCNVVVNNNNTSLSVKEMVESQSVKYAKHINVDIMIKDQLYKNPSLHD